MNLRLVALSLCLALVAAACDGTTDTTADCTTSGTESVSSEPTTSAPPGDTDVAAIHFAYLSGLIAVPMAEVDATQPLLEDMGIDQTATVDDVLGEEGLGNEEVEAARSLLAGMIQIYVVNDDQDPLQIAEAIRNENQDLRIAPIHAVGEAGHSGYQSGTDPEPMEGVSIDPSPECEAGEGADLAAVVDSGIYPEAPWLAGSVEEPVDPIDIEPASQDGHSHGTFVSSIIRQLSPEHRITFARARRVPVGELAWSDGQLGPTELTELITEIHVAEAILRLVDRHQDEDQARRVRSLTLALGGYTTTTGEDLWMTTTALAIDEWLEVFPETTVFAAAGNAAVPQTFWPAALENVIGVAALNDPASGSPAEIVWDQNHNEVPWASLSSTPRPSTDEMAPGSQLAQYAQPELVVCWSGSSFAAAAATGLHLRNQSPIPDRRLEVENLSYCQDGDVVTAG